MTTVLRCNLGCYHLGDYGCTVDENHSVMPVIASSHQCFIKTSYFKDRYPDELTQFVLAVKHEDKAAHTIATRLGCTLKGETGQIVSAFIAWYRVQQLPEEIDLSECGLENLPVRIADVFSGVHKLNLSGNKGLSSVPDHLQVDILDISRTGISTVPCEVAKKIVMTGNWVTFPEKIFSQSCRLKQLILGSEVLQGHIEDLSRLNLEYIEIGSYRGAPEQVEKVIRPIAYVPSQSIID